MVTAEPQPPPNDRAILSRLVAAGCLGHGVRVDPLGGGVSSDVLLVRDDDGRHLVVKRALERLKVADDWRADPRRNASEQAWLRVAAGLVPGNAPRILFAAPEEGWFAMEYFGDGWVTWKQGLMAGDADPMPALEAGAMLGRLHHATWESPAVAEQFDTLRNFTELRIDPYFLTCAQRLPDLAPWLHDLCRRLAAQRQALVHGDFSPKNLLVRTARLVILDAEVAWYGDPAFDVAFLVHHLLLKALHHAGTAAAGHILSLPETFVRAYADQLPAADAAAVEGRAAELVLALLLARVHGKSPVEYLSVTSRDAVTSFVRTVSPTPPRRIAELARSWEPLLA